MEEKSTSVMKPALINGLMLGAALIIFDLILHFAGLKFNKVVGWGMYVIIIGIIVYATNKYRNNVLEGNISYGKALGLATLIIVFAAFVYSIYTYFYITAINPGHLADTLAQLEEQMLQKGLPDGQVEMALSMQRKMMKPGIVTISGFFGTAIIGFVIALITSIFLKKEGDPYQDVMQDIEE